MTQEKVGDAREVLGEDKLTVANDPITAVLCCAAGGYTALELGENCDWLSATGSEAAGFIVVCCC